MLHSLRRRIAALIAPPEDPGPVVMFRSRRVANPQIPATDDGIRTFPIIEKLGGRHAVAALVRRADDRGAVPVTVDTVRMWIARSSIPGYAVRQMMAEAERRGIEVGAADFERCRKPQQEAA